MKQVNFDSLSESAFVRMASLPAIVGMSVPTIWRKTKEGCFPKPIKVSSNITAWKVGSIREWLKDPMGFRDGNEV